MTEYRIYKNNDEYADDDPSFPYGIALYENGIRTRLIGDLCGDRELLSRFVCLLNEEELDPIHLDQAVEDFLYDFSF